MRSLLLVVALLVAPGASPVTPSDPTRAIATTQAFDRTEPVPTRRAAARVARWPGGVVRYYDASRDSDALRRATRIWNTSGLKVRFVKVRKRSKAQLVVVNQPSGGCGNGMATVGYTPQARVWITHGGPERGQTCGWPGKTILLLHELGHVLGLGHDDRRCSIMNSSYTNGVAPSRCLTPDPDDRDEQPGTWRCRGLERIDLIRVKRLYGATRKLQARQPATCELHPRLADSGAIAVTPTPEGTVTVTVTRPPEPPLLDFLEVDGQDAMYRIRMDRAACGVGSGSPFVVRSDVYTVPPGQTETLTLNWWSEGTECWSLLSYDRLGRAAPTETSVQITTPVQ